MQLLALLSLFSLALFVSAATPPPSAVDEIVFMHTVATIEDWDASVLPLEDVVANPMSEEEVMESVRRGCARDEEVCPVKGAGVDGKWECVDTRSDERQCGGCGGINCNSILGVQSGFCFDGICEALDCLPGFRMSQFVPECVPFVARKLRLPKEVERSIEAEQVEPKEDE